MRRRPATINYSALATLRTRESKFVLKYFRIDRSGREIKLIGRKSKS